MDVNLTPKMCKGHLQQIPYSLIQKSMLSAPYGLHKGILKVLVHIVSHNFDFLCHNFDFFSPNLDFLSPNFNFLILYF